MEKRNYIFLGPPGSGKGTQAKDLAKDLGFIYFGTGDLMRKEAELGTEFGKIFKGVWDRGKGELISDDVVAKFVEAKIHEIGTDKQYIFDGFPRTLDQAKLLEKIFTDAQTPFLVLNIDVSSDSLIERMQTRRVCEACGKIFFQAEKMGVRKCTACGGKLIQRQEDTPEVIKERIRVYEDQTKPLIKFYKEKGILVDIDGEPPIEEVANQVSKVING